MNLSVVPPMPPSSPPPENVDEGELEKFAALAHQWWDPESAMFGPLHKMNPVRLEWIDRMAGGLAGKRVVDVGCGGGILTESMAKRGAVALGIDLGAKALGVARLHKLESGVEVDYRLVSAETLATESPHNYEKLLQPAEIAAFARRAGLSPAGIIGMAYNPIAKTFKLTDDPAVNYMMAFRGSAKDE